MLNKIKPLGDNILVKRKEEEVIKGGIILAQTNKQPGDRAIAIAVGPGRNNIMPIAVGDELIIERFPHKTVVLDDVEYCFLSVGDVLGVITS
jgi:co-chaperonin GroES (HSP10)